MQPRHNEIAAVLRAVLEVSGTGLHLTRYHRYCPAPGVLDFLGHLYEACLDPTNLEAPTNLGRAAVHALFGPLGALSNILLGIERAVSWRELVASSKIRGAGIIVHLDKQFKASTHYLAAVEDGQLDEQFHRAHIPLGALAALPWDMTAKWFLRDGTQTPWWTTPDRGTLAALANVAAVLFRAEPELATLFWETVGAPELVLGLPDERAIPLMRRLRREPLSDALLAETFTVPEVVELVESERIGAFLTHACAWLGGTELSSPQASPPPADAIEELAAEEIELDET